MFLIKYFLCKLWFKRYINIFIIWHACECLKHFTTILFSEKYPNVHAKSSWNKRCKKHGKIIQIFFFWKLANQISYCCFCMTHIIEFMKSVNSLNYLHEPLIFYYWISLQILRCLISPQLCTIMPSFILDYCNN